MRLCVLVVRAACVWFVVSWRWKRKAAENGKANLLVFNSRERLQVRSKAVRTLLGGIGGIAGVDLTTLQNVFSGKGSVYDYAHDLENWFEQLHLGVLDSILSLIIVDRVV